MGPSSGKSTIQFGTSHFVNSGTIGFLASLIVEKKIAKRGRDLTVYCVLDREGMGDRQARSYFLTGGQEDCRVLTTDQIHLTADDADERMEEETTRSKG